MILLDTHIWLWWLSGDNLISSDERQALDQYALRNELCISSITIWEVEILDRKGKLSFSPNFELWMQKILNIDSFKILPIQTDVIMAQRSLPEDFHGDPADRLIAATSIKTGNPLATKDQRIIDSGACEIWNI
ncbi:MAG: type II toxin-antitoxin system VapC family toxin [Gracilimonas sp.]|nr:type II toxin-antitoxin system VapC family toxin [Gracilimonas sp.]